MAYSTITDATLTEKKALTQATLRQFRDNDEYLKGVADGYAQGVGHILLASYSPSAAASVDITSVLTSTYKRYRIEVYDIIPATDDATLILRTSTDNGSTFDSGASDYDYVFTATNANSNALNGNSTGATSMLLHSNAINGGQGTAAGESGNFTIDLLNPLGTANRKQARWNGSYTTATGYSAIVNGAGARLATADVDAVQLLYDSGNIESGQVRVYALLDS